MPWTPLVTGDLAAAATAAAYEIAVALAQRPAGPATDRALFWAYASAAFDEPFARAAHGAALDDLIAELRRRPDRVGLAGGLADAGWTLCHVLDSDDALDAIDEALLAILAVDRWTGAHDLLEGLAGLGVYFLERIAAGAGDRARDGLAAVVAQLARTAIESDAGLAWHTPLALLPPAFAAAYPAGFYDCGLAHGAPGIAAVLARAGSPLCRDATRWILAQQQGGRFPAKLVGGAVPTSASAREAARTGWCYGDPGVALALASVQGDGAVDQAADLALAAVQRDGIVDPGLCHGVAGLAHVCNRFFHATGDAAFAEHARRWYARAVALPRPDDASLLEGSAGLGLALLAATTSTEPAWDRRLLCDLPLHQGQP